MAILYSYPQATPDLVDLVLGSKFINGEGLVTKSFTLSEIGQLFNNTYSSNVQSLTTNGNSGSATLVGGVLNVPNYSPEYTSYYARLTQSGADPITGIPSINMLYNDTGWTITASRLGIGSYLITVSGHLATVNNCYYALTDNRFSLGLNQNYATINQATSTQLQIYTFKAGVLSDSLLLETPLEIKFF